MQRAAPYSYHLGEEHPRLLPSVYAADLELARGVVNTTSYTQSGFSGNVTHPYTAEKGKTSNKEIETKYSKYITSPVYCNSITETPWYHDREWKYSFHMYSTGDAPFGKGADALKPRPSVENATDNNSTEKVLVSSYFEP
ncbi:hypothetical protein Q1695_002660 [Nippostrongylus brasiliensis]|nr:hypothetical protein Q1695_002660 [Nippostrongylus brasiliensis]